MKPRITGLMLGVDVSGLPLALSSPTELWSGYAGYFRDPEGHLWEVVWNPQLIVPTD